MKHQRVLTNADITEMATEVVKTIYDQRGIPSRREPIFIHGIPTGGIPAAYAVAAADNLRNIKVTDDPREAEFFIDDIIDTGRTMEKYIEKFNKPVLALVNKLSVMTGDRIVKSPYKNDWIVFPWEGGVDGSIEDNVIRMLQFIGEDPNRGGLKETPARVAKAWQEWFSGYALKPEDVLKTFEDGANGVDEMVVVRAPVYSFCEHHIAPIFGHATVAYIPDGKIVGLSKLARLVNVFSRRLQVQERLTNQIADAIQTHLQPTGVGVLISARHMCMESRGVNINDGQPTISSALRGAIKDKPAARAEFLSIALR